MERGPRPTVPPGRDENCSWRPAWVVTPGKKLGGHCWLAEEHERIPRPRRRATQAKFAGGRNLLLRFGWSRRLFAVLGQRRQAVAKRRIIGLDLAVGRLL